MCIHKLMITSIIDACGCCEPMPRQGAGEITLVCVCVRMIPCLLKQGPVLFEKAKYLA